MSRCIRLTLIIFLFTNSVSSLCQKDSIKIRRFSEFSISINHTVHSNDINDRYEGKFGLGFGAYHVYRVDKRLQTLFGFELNVVNVFINRFQEHKYLIYENMDVNMNWLSVPFCFRFNVGDKIKSYVKWGASLHVPIIGHKKGHENWLYWTHDNDQDISRFFYGRPNFSVDIGTGISIPRKSGVLMFEMNYKQALIPIMKAEFTRLYTPYISIQVRFRKS